MRISVWRIFIVSLCSSAFLSPGAARAAEESIPPSLSPGTPVTRATAYISVVKQGTGVLSLQIDYPWDIYTKPSIEVRQLLNDGPESARPRPTYFVDYFLKGETLVTIGQCLDSAYGVGSSTHIKVDRNTLALDVLGQRNSLGRPAVSVLWKNSAGQGSEKEEVHVKPSQLGSWAAFCHLENWSLNRHQLCLDLPQAYFAKPGKLMVWFLRADTVIWQKQLDWTGYPKGDSPSGS
jgi:hypothetical protein